MLSSNEAKDGSPVKPFQPGVNNFLNKKTVQSTARRRQINDNPANPETVDPNGSVNLSGPGNKERFTYLNSITNEEETKMLYPERKKIIHPERNNFFKKEAGLIPDTFSFRLYDQLVSFLQTSKQRSSKTISRKGFYYGVLAGAELNRVKNQHFKKPGWNLGLLAGYSFLKKFSVETGLLVSQKYYTTSGNYFSMKEIGAAMPPPMKIMEVEGSSKLIEIPLVLRYYAIQNFQRTFFASAGFSSYILNKENNQYHTYMNGAEQMMYGHYDNNRHYFAAAADIGIGYEQALGIKNNIRLQPYIQLPLKGIGVGRLQLMGAGVRVAIIHQAH